MDGARRNLAIALALLMASLSIAIPAQAASTPYMIENRQELLTPIMDDGDIDCTQFDGCPEEARGVSFLDYHVGPELEEDEHEDVAYVFYNVANVGYFAYHNEVVAYDLCMFNEDKDLMRCDAIVGGWVSGENIREDTEYMRVIMRDGALGEYHLEIWGVN